MQVDIFNGKLPDKVRQQIDDYAKTTTDDVDVLAARSGLTQEQTEALRQDVANVFTAHYTPYTPTAAEMGCIFNKTARTRNEVNNPVISDVLEDYGRIHDAVVVVRACADTPAEQAKQIPRVLPTTTGGRFLQSIARAETLRNIGAKPTAGQLQDAVRRAYARYILTAVTYCNVDAEALYNALYGDVAEAPTTWQAQYLKGAVFTQRRQQGVLFDEDGEPHAVPPQEQEQEPAAIEIKSAPTLYSMALREAEERRNVGVRQWQNVTQMLGDGLKTADDKDAALRPLVQQLDAMRARAEAILADSSSTDEQKQRAGELLTTPDYVYKVWDGLQIVATTEKATAETQENYEYELDVQKYVTICTGQEKPNNEMKYAVLRATKWLATQRTEVDEERILWATAHDEDGKELRNEDGTIQEEQTIRKYRVNFAPVGVVFRTDITDGVPLTKATRLTLSIPRLLVTGKQRPYALTLLDNGKKKELQVYQRSPHVVTIEQMYDFNSDDEKRFRNIIVSKYHWEQSKLLAAVFDYDGKQQQADKRAQKAQDAWKRADAMATTTEQERSVYEDHIRNLATTIPDEDVREMAVNACGYTEQEKQQLKAAADKAKKAAKYLITNHRGRDIETLTGMFEKAKTNGLLTSYYTEQGLRDVVWNWCRPVETDEKKKKEPRRRSKYVYRKTK